MIRTAHTHAPGAAQRQGVALGKGLAAVGDAGSDLPGGPGTSQHLPATGRVLPILGWWWWLWDVGPPDYPALAGEALAPPMQLQRFAICPCQGIDGL